MTLKTTGFLIALLCSVNFSLLAQFYTFREYTHKDGLKISTTLTSTQDSLGNLYIGTDGDGIVRFDGNTFSNVFKTRMEKPYHVTGIVIRKNTIYFSTQYSGIIRYSENKFTQLINLSLEKHGVLSHLTACEDNLMFLTSEGIFIIDLKGNIIRKKKISANLDLRVVQIISLPKGNVLFTNHGSFFASKKGISPLYQWLETSNEKFDFGYFSEGKLTCYSSNSGKVFHFLLDHSCKKKEASSSSYPFGPLSSEQIQLAASKNNQVLISTKKKDLYKVSETQPEKILHNTLSSFESYYHLLIDQGNDYWVNTSHGLLKVSLEPFTRISLNNLFLNNSITSTYVGKNNDYILNVIQEGVFVGNFSSPDYKCYKNMMVYHILDCPLGVFLCTKDGFYEYKNGSIAKSSLIKLDNIQVNFALWKDGKIWIGTKNDGLLCYDSKTKQCTTVISNTDNRIYYCGEKSHDGKWLYFGTNNKIIALNIETGKHQTLEAFSKFGSYCGNSTKDMYGTVWFTMDKGLAGITKNHEYIKISDKKILPSILLYTLTSDLYGNLIVGTNLGLHIIRVNEKGKVLHYKTYNYQNGFTGYETNMRSSFQDGNKSYVGTTQGLYFINMETLNNYPVPPKPIIKKGRVIKSGLVKDVDNGQYLTFETILPKNRGIDYYYRILSVDTNWTELATYNELKIPELENGSHTLQVKSTYDDIHFSEIANYEIEISKPVWESKWFIVIVVLFLGLLNIGYLEWTRTGMKIDMYEIDYNSIDARFIPKLLTFAAIVNLFVGVIIHYFVDSELGNIQINLLGSGLLILLRLTFDFLSGRKNGEWVISSCFYLAILILFIQYFVLLYISNIHPYPLIAIILISSALPYMIKNIYSIIIICLLVVCVSILILLWVALPIYNGILFILSIGVSSALTILVTYLRNDSLEKMYFVSNILNRGNMIVLSFNQKGIFNYCSKNISNFFNIDANQLIGKSISAINPIVVSEEMRDFSLENEFEDGKVFLAPMYNNKGEIVWIEWSCKYFSHAVRVILGQDVTEKLTVTTNYQSLVENAHDMIFNTDIDGNFLFLNEMSSRIFGYRNENLIGKNSVAMIHPDYRDQVKEFFRNQIINRISNTYLEFPIKTKDGRTIWLGQNASLVFEPGSRRTVIGFTALARDITEKRANELLIEQQNKDITSSINSAKRIQYSLIPKASEIGKYFDDFFLLFKPKDIVSGDFYWAHYQNNKLILILADCTGHGVPGAFMTILGFNLLNQLIIERKIEQPDEILNQLNRELQTLLHQDQTTLAAEGMDTLIVVFEGDKLHYASSGVALIHVSDEEFSLSRSTKIADSESSESRYLSHTITLKQSDKLYLITNGFQKQFGSIRNKKFSFKRIMELLRNIHVESMPLQKKYFENAWSNWSEGHEQTDDITVIGLQGFKQKEQ